MENYTFRLLPGQDLAKSIADFVYSQHISAGCVVTCVGSLTTAAIRFADKPEAIQLDGCFEIVSLAGTVGMAGQHLHISIADGEGRMLGGHLKDGSIVHTTAEIVLASFTGKVFRREFSPDTGYDELVIYTVQEPKSE